MVVARLAVLYWQRGGVRQRATLALTAAGVMVSVVLGLLVLSVGPALQTRADHIAWRNADGNVAMWRDAQPSALQRTTSDQYRGRAITRVDLAPIADTPEDGAPTSSPPGMARFPAAGEVFASPAMAALLAETPDDELGDRYPGVLAGTIGGRGLAYDAELVVVVGHPAGALVATGVDEAKYPPPLSQVADGDVVPIAGFAWRGNDPDIDQYQTLARMAAVLLVVPTFLLVGAAARLTASQREQRLAVLRLVGATPAVVVGLAALETLVAAVVGTALGIAGYLLVLPLAANIPLGGGSFPVADLRFGVEALVATLVIVPLAAAASALVALRKVVVGPLGVTRRTKPRRPNLLRFAVVPVAWALFMSSAASMRDGGSSAGALVGLGAVIATLAVVGPWIAWIVGALLTAGARHPAALIAGRRIGADPRGAYRTVSGMVLAGLIAGFLFAVIPTMESVALGDEARRELSVVATPTRVPEVRRAVAAADPDARVALTGWSDTDGTLSGTVVSSSTERVDRVRTAVAGVDPSVLVTSWDGDGRARTFLDDLERASLVMALASLAMATASTAIGAASSILDQRVTLARLRLVGTPIAALQRARRWQTLVPLVVASTGAMASGAVAGVVMMVAFDVGTDRIQRPDLVGMAALSAASVIAGIVVVGLTRPLLVATSRSSPRE